MSRFVDIHYHRPPDDRVVYRQRILHADAEVTVTWQPETPVRKPMRVDGRTVLEPESPAIWFTFPGAWHDIGRFHLRDGTFTGIYANILTPVEEQSEGDELIWSTRDLFLDLFLDLDGEPHLLDEDEFEAALSTGAIDGQTAQRARSEADRLIRKTGEGSWPPPVVREWSIDRVRALLGDAPGD